MKQYRIAPSILSADMSRLGEEVSTVLQAGGDMIHFDVMDNHYVPNLTFGSMICSSLRNYGITAPIDVHLMASPVDSLIEDFAKAGASYITIHPEASAHPDRSLQLIRDCGCKAGLSFNPGTPLSWLDYTIERLDLILVMSVNPGFGGQKFISSAYEKIRAIRSRIADTGREILLEVDGGIHSNNIASIAEAGADTFVSGSAIFNSENYGETIKDMREKLASVHIS